MSKTSLFAAVLLLAAAGLAEAGGQPNSIGVGVEAQINGIGGGSLNYDAGDFHVGGFFGFHDPGNDDDDTLVIGGRFFYHVHSTAMSDFGIGGTIGLASDNNPPPTDRESLLFIEPSFQIRAFIAANVALSFNAGIVIGVMDAETVDVGGQLVGGGATFSAGATGFAAALTGGAGVHYYFW
jgi:hypothetical protein